MITKHRYLLQKTIEEKISKRGIQQKVFAHLSQTYPVEIEKITSLIPVWLEDPDHWDGKKQRLAEIVDIDFKDTITNILAIIAVNAQEPMKLVSVSAMAAKYLRMQVKADSIQTCAELIAICTNTKLVRWARDNENSVIIQSGMTLDQETRDYIKYACYLPPMLHRPRKLRSNRHSGYITLHGESLILGGYSNHHDGNISLDVLNTLNSTCFEIDTAFISTFQEERHHAELTEEEYRELSRAEKDLYDMDEKTWEEYQEQCRVLYKMIIDQGNELYFTHKVDKRGRVYSQGYHMNPQGKAYKKAMLNLKKKEICTGVKEWQKTTMLSA